MDAIARAVQRKAGKMNQCDICEEMGCKDCMHCELGNPCLDCDDYDERTDKCTSNGGCEDWRDAEDG